MRISLRLCAAAAAVGLVNSQASACEDYCGYGYGPAAYVYYAPPVYFAPTAYEFYVPIGVYPGPRWGYGAPYHTAPVVYGARWRPRAYYAPRRIYVRPYYARSRPFQGWRRW